MTSTPQSDATPTYRGYRLQALYALSRILEENRKFYFQPDGKEDLAIFGQNHRLLEIVQVKAYTGPLTLSRKSFA